MLSVATLNVRGILDDEKRRILFNYLKGLKFDIYLIQEAHCTDNKVREKICFNWCQRRDRAYSKFFRTTRLGAPARGVGVLLNPKSEVYFTDDEDLIDANGRYITTSARKGEALFNVCCVYGPNEAAARADFFGTLCDTLL